MLLLLAVLASSAPPVRPKVQASASVRIERPAIANREQWEQSPSRSRREIIVYDEAGRPTLLRVIDYE